jgi:riboflavin kinase/FMN adenylyltransferase
MQYLTEISAYQSEKRSAVTLGKFDCLHRGHQLLIDRVRELSDEDTCSIVCAFDMGKESLLTNEERRARLEGEVDCLIECPFTKELREMEAEQFIRRILVDTMHVKDVIIGTDFRFGYEVRGDAEMLQKYAGQYGYRVEVIEKKKYHEREISSTYVRELLKEGNVKLASRLLGYTYCTSGTVEHGKRLGRTLGFPTMNVSWDGRKIAPRYGVYACETVIDGTVYPSIGNVGVKPTVAKIPQLLAEVYVFGYEGDAYGKKIEIRFLDFERPEMRFDSVEELKHQVDIDLLYGRAYFNL